MTEPSFDPVVEQTGTRIRIRLAVAAPATALFAVLADPRRHAEIDGSGMVQAAAGTEPITALGQIFTMAMFRPDLGEYRTDNHVVEFADGRRIAWLTAREGQPSPGVRWSWVLDDIDRTRTAVTHIYDWTDVTDPAVLARVSFRRVSADQLVATMRRLEVAVS